MNNRAQKWLSSKVKKVTKIKIDDNDKPHTQLQTMKKRPKQFQIDQYKTVGRVARTIPAVMYLMHNI